MTKEDFEMNMTIADMLGIPHGPKDHSLNWIENDGTTPDIEVGDSWYMETLAARKLGMDDVGGPFVYGVNSSHLFDLPDTVAYAVVKNG